MGRDWYWGGGNRSSSSSKRGGNGGYKHTVKGSTTGYSTSSCSSTTATTASGCMSAVFHFFDFHHYQFPLHHHHQPSSPPPPLKPTSPQLPLHDQEEQPISLKGVEAPRNSLELSEEASLSSANKEEESLNIPMGIQIKTIREGDTRSSASYNEFSSEIISCSPGGSKTPNLLARLMGLDLLPDNNPSLSPSSSNLGTPNLQKPYAILHCNNHSRARQTLHSKQITRHRNSIDGDIIGTRSLPETPRISSARRSDVEHRLSLQLNKENMCGSDQELEFSRFSSLRRKDLKQEDENRSPREYARQIVKQVKENVSRKVGMDITNTLKNRDHQELVAQLKSKKSSRFSSRVLDVAHHDTSPAKSAPSCSPRLRFLESKTKQTNNTTSSSSSSSSIKEQTFHQPKPQVIHPPSSLQQASTQPEPVKISTRAKLVLPVVQEEHQQQKKQQRPIKKCKKGDSERFGSRLAKPLPTTDIVRNKQEEPFVRPSTPNKPNIIIPDKKSRKTPFSNDLLNITLPISLLPVKKDPSPPATKLVQKQVTEAQASKRTSQLSSSASQTYKQEARRLLIVPDNNSHDRFYATPISISPPNTTTKTAAHGAEHDYITRIIRRIGVGKDTPVSFARLFSPSHPLDPSIFHYLEHLAITGKTQLSLRCNRKLLFHLVDEILVEILKPYMNLKPWANPVDRRDCYIGSELIDMLCARIRSFPCADCRVLEDIDALIDRDLTRNHSLQLQGPVAFEEEGEGIVAEIEKDILETLVHETAADLWVCVW